MAFRARAADMGVAISEAQAALLFRYLAMVEAANREMNLTGIRDFEEAVERHLLESLAGWRVWLEVEKKVVTGKGLGEPVEGGLGSSAGSGAGGGSRGGGSDGSVRQGWRLRLVDIGSGAGFPGLAMALAVPEGIKVEASLVEATRKKAEFLEKVSRELGVESVRVWWSRAEELGRSQQHREQYHLAVSRAVAPIAVLAEYCLPLVEVGGWALWWKGSQVEEELAQGVAAVEIMGGKVREIVRLELPGWAEKEGREEEMEGLESRASGGGLVREEGQKDQGGLAWVAVEKVAPTPERFPRRPGIPAKRPWREKRE